MATFLSGGTRELIADASINALDEARRAGIPDWEAREEFVRALQALHPGDGFVFIIGADTLPELHTWHQPLELLSLVRIVTLARPGFVPDAAALQLPPPWPARLLADLRTGDPLDVSSRDVRAKIAAGQPLSLVPEPVQRYIQEHNLYR